MFSTGNRQVEIFAGLGNQLFQWSFAHLAYDGVAFEMLYDEDPRRPDRPFALSGIERKCAHVDRVTQRHRRSRRLARWGGAARRRAARAGITFDTKVFNEVYQFAQPDMHSVRKAKRIRGYFQHFQLVEDVFAVVSPELTSWLTEVEVPEILLERPVMHFRIGDLRQPECEGMGILAERYYRQAAEVLRVNPRDFVGVTDDVRGAKPLADALQLSLLLGPEDLNPRQALRVMAHSSVMVAANSTLSWWAARLSHARGGRGVLPHPWFKSWPTDPEEAFLFPGAIVSQAAFRDVSLIPGGRSWETKSLDGLLGGQR